MFDHLDFVFFDGDENLLPWSPRCHKFLILLRMCKKTNKLTFCCSFAMHLLVYLCATNLYINRVVNGSGKGSPKPTFTKMDRSVLEGLVYGDVVLDSTTGDVYGYDTTKREFYPMANVGLHNHKEAQESGRF